MAQMVGISQSRLSEVQGENPSIVGTDNACIPDLRYKLSQEQQDEILKRLGDGETQEENISNVQTHNAYIQGLAPHARGA